MPVEQLPTDLEGTYSLGDGTVTFSAIRVVVDEELGGLGEPEEVPFSEPVELKWKIWVDKGNRFTDDTEVQLTVEAPES